ncbi:serine/threonine-protein kinase [Herbidospora cretacea]|uniref:serine/threonine-protein kinase n=1 Tax=Herbidospora cretacea TaxID=28444 RepID=UPI00069113F9|nr:serine/threonine-protein kinase [Herbidospora cretacea]
MATPLHPDDPRSLGEYRLTGRLGEGGQGVVYLGVSPSGTHVAVKLLRGADDGVRHQLGRELAALRDVAPFCTARVLAADVAGRRPYVVSEYVDGPSLQERVSSAGPLTGGELERLAVGTATALAAVHAAGVVHRDFKPGNVLLGPDGPRVVDFGIARPSESQTITGGPIGTPAYMAPEQIAGHPASAASDVFAWGATIVYAATGRAAFGSDSVASVLHRIMTVDPDVSGVPAPLRGLVARCVAKDPAARPSARDLLLTLVGAAPDPLRAGEAAAHGHPPHPGGPGSGSRAASGTGPPDPRGSIDPAPGLWADDPDRRRFIEPPAWAGHPTREGAASGAPRHSMQGPGAPPPATPPAHGKALALVFAALGAALFAVAAVFVPQLLSPDREPAVVRTTSTPTQVRTSAAPPQEIDPTATTSRTTSASGVPEAFDGRWEGHIVPSNPVMSEHEISIDLDAGETTGKWSEDPCEGTLTLTRASARSAEFRLDGLGGQCVPGTVVLTLKGDQAEYVWNDDLGLLSYTGTLTRT